MKKLIYCLLFMFIILAGCNPKIVQIECVQNNIVADIKEFNISNYNLKVKYNNDNETQLPITKDMINSSDLEKLNILGEHTITINYEGLFTTLNITLTKKVIDFDVDLTNVNKEIDKFKLSDIKLIVMYSDNSKDTIDCSNEMLSEKDNQKLTKLGYHKFYINYQGLYKVVEITLEKHINIRFICDDEVIYEETIKVGEMLTKIPDVKEKENYTGIWDLDDFSNLCEDTDVTAIYTYNKEVLFEELKQELLNMYSNITVESNLKLVTSYKDCTITWQNEYISNNGTLSRPYKKTNSYLIATLNYNGDQEQISIPVTIEGYKSLDKGIASNYIYRYYNKVTAEYFDTMDIIYCAFMEIDTKGGFSGVDASNNSIASSNARVRENIKNYIMPKAKEKGIYVIVSLGGGGAAPRDTFKIIAGDATLRKTFANNIVNLINNYGYDGVDIDWETPTATEKENFTLLTKEIYEAVKKNNPNHFVTAAIGGGKWQPPRYDLTNSGKYLDYINIMTYSMCSESGYYQNALYPSSTFHNAEAKVGKTLISCSMEESKQIFLNYNIPASKMIFGFAFYGIKEKLVNGVWSSGGSVMYDKIKAYQKSADYTYHFDDIAKVPYLLSADKTIFITYDDPMSIKIKCKYVLDNKMAGVMYWENGCDTTGDLVHAINEGMNKK